MSFTKITISADISATIEKVWAAWTQPEHITQWTFASDDWHCPSATNDLQVGGKFTTRMEAKDGSFGFDFGGTYNEVTENQSITYTMDDSRKATTTFAANGDTTKVTTVFDAENENPIELQQGGWQAILNNFKKYAESE